MTAAIASQPRRRYSALSMPATRARTRFPGRCGVVLAPLLLMMAPGCIETGEDCSLDAYTECHQGNVYWFDSCGKPGSLKEQCPGGACSFGQCEEQRAPDESREEEFESVDGNPIDLSSAYPDLLLKGETVWCYCWLPCWSPGLPCCDLCRPSDVSSTKCVQGFSTSGVFCFGKSESKCKEAQSERCGCEEQDGCFTY